MAFTFLRTVRIAAQPAVTISKQYFKGAGVVWANNIFQAEFYSLEVPTTEEIEIAVHRLKKSLFDAPILAELGDKAKISVSQFRTFLAANRESLEWFIFYLSGRNGKRAVYAYWSVNCGGWRVGARSVTRPDEWRQGYRVVSQV